jgi:hypothetical protein
VGTATDNIKKQQKKQKKAAGEALPPSKSLTGPASAPALGLRAETCSRHRIADRFLVQEERAMRLI